MPTAEPTSYTGADPGGWGWSDLSGSVPDGDDTPGAMLAIKQERHWTDAKRQQRIDTALENGQCFLSSLQNRDGGWPTFCRGWGKLPFDRSSVDLTAHALRAIGDGVDEATLNKSYRFLKRQQQDDGSWLPLWFGNQDHTGELNPVYGTSRVILAGCPDSTSLHRGVGYLLEHQNADGGWGGGTSVGSFFAAPLALSDRTTDENNSDLEKTQEEDFLSTVEETALAVEALSTFVLIQRDTANHNDCETDAIQCSQSPQNHAKREISDAALSPVDSVETNDLQAAILSGVEFLIRSVADDRHRVAWPIGFYFAKLWYYERLYPLVFSVAALGKYLRVVADVHDPNWPK